MSASSETGFAGPSLRKITYEDPWRWLAKGWNDVTTIPSISLTYGFVFFLELAIVAAILVGYRISAIALPIAAGIVLMGPALAAGLYKASKRLEAGESVALKDVFIVQAVSKGQLALFGVALVLIFMVWLRIAMLLFALFFSQLELPPIETFLSDLFLTNEGISMMVVGTIIGGAIAGAIFMISVVSVPMLMDRDVDAMSAIIYSIRAFFENFAPMVLWGWLIVVIFIAGLALGGLGLIVAFPVIGHATWHAYRAVVDWHD